MQTHGKQHNKSKYNEAKHNNNQRRKEVARSKTLVGCMNLLQTSVRAP